MASSFDRYIRARHRQISSDLLRSAFSPELAVGIFSHHRRAIFSSQIGDRAYFSSLSEDRCWSILERARDAIIACVNLKSDIVGRVEARQLDRGSFARFSRYSRLITTSNHVTMSPIVGILCPSIIADYTRNTWRDHPPTVYIIYVTQAAWQFIRRVFKRSAERYERERYAGNADVPRTWIHGRSDRLCFPRELLPPRKIEKRGATSGRSVR